MTRHIHTISIGMYQVYNVDIEADTPEQALINVDQEIAKHGLHDALPLMDARECPVCNEQSPFIQHEWSKHHE